MAGHGDCDICLEPYDSAKIPKFLQCFHTICIECLKSLHCNGSITCPSCRKQTIVDDINALQTNYYLAASSREISNADEQKGAAKAEDETLLWCEECARIVKKCNKDSHSTYGLNTALGREMAEHHLQSNELMCRLQWETSLKKREEFASTLSAITQALQSILREVGLVEKNNNKQKKKIEHHLKELAESTSKQGKEEKLSEKNLATRCQKFDCLAAESKTDIKEISALLLSISSLQNAVVSLAVQTENKGKLTVPLLEGIKAGFQDNGTVLSDFKTVLSYLILSSIEEGKIFQLERENVAALKKKEPNKAVIAATQTKPVKDTKPSKEAAPSTQAKVVPSSKKGPAPQDSKKSNETNSGVKAKMMDKKPPGSQPKANQPPNKSNFVSKQRPPVPQVNPINPISSLLQNPQAMMETMLNALTSANIRPALNLTGKKCFMEVSVNGNLYGRFEIELRPDVAPLMCQSFAQACEGKNGLSYHGTVIYKREPMSYILGGRIPSSPEYMADSSPLKRGRGAVFFRLKKDIEQVKCPIVSSEFIVQLNDAKKESTWPTTVFGFVTPGLAICDAVSHLDPSKDHISFSKVGIC